MSVSTISSTAYAPPAPTGQSTSNLDQAPRPTAAQSPASSPAPTSGTPEATSDIITLSKQAISRSLQESASSQSPVAATGSTSDTPVEKRLKAAAEKRSTQPQDNPIAHIVEEYNLQGKLRVKFMDRNNNVVYQLPPEMVAKMEDMMMRPDKTTETTV